MEKNGKNLWNLSCKKDNHEEPTFKQIEENAPKKISVERLRQYKGLENISEEEASNIIESLYKLAIISYYFYCQTEENEIRQAA